MIRILWIFFISFLMVGPAGAEPVTLQQAMTEATSERPMVRAADQEARAATAAVGEARSRLFPQVTLTESFYATDEPAGSLFISLNQEDLTLYQTAEPYNHPPSRKDFETRLTLQQPLFDPDISYGLKRAQKSSAAAVAGTRRSKESAAFAAFQAYLEVQQAHAALDWIVSSEAEAAEILRLAKDRQQTGIGLKADVLRAEVMTGQTRQLRISAENDLLLAKRSLALAMGRDSDAVDISAPVTSSQLTDQAAASPMARADLDALSLRVEEAELGYRQSRADYLPRLGLNASYALHDGAMPFGNEASSWSIQAALSWELFDGFRRSRQGERTAATQKAMVAQLQEAERQARFQVEQAHLRADEARQHLAVAESSLTAAEESRRLLVERYQAGLADLSAMLSTQEALDRARFDLVGATTRHILALGNVAFQNGTFLQALAVKQEDSK